MTTIAFIRYSVILVTILLHFAFTIDYLMHAQKRLIPMVIIIKVEAEFNFILNS